jgi:hypothetical protein
MMACEIDCAPSMQHNVAARGRALVLMTPSPCASPQHVIKGAHATSDSNMQTFMMSSDDVAQRQAARLFSLVIPILCQYSSLIGAEPSIKRTSALKTCR